METPGSTHPLRLAEWLIPLILLIGGASYWILDRRYRQAREASTRELERREREAMSLSALIDQLSISAAVIDPNNDRVRYRNVRAQELGIEVNREFRDYVLEEDRPRYDASNRAAGGGERAYGVRLRLNNGVQQVIVRSRAVSGRISSLEARENDRFGLFAVLGSEDTSELRARIEDQAARHERTKLGALLTHGISLTTYVAARDPALGDAVPSWLMTYLDRRLNVIAELLAGWQEPLKDVRQTESMVPKSSMLHFLDMLQHFASFVASDRQLRGELRWGNGVLSELPADASPFTYDLSAWPQDVAITTHVTGAELFIIEELLVNAFKHGRPGVPPTLRARVVTARDRRWVEFECRNEIRPNSTPLAGAHLYGGRDLVIETCRRINWELQEPALHDNVYAIRVWAPTIGAIGDPGLEKVASL